MRVESVPRWSRSNANWGWSDAYQVELAERARRSLAELPADVRRRLVRELERLVRDPWHPGTTALVDSPYRRARVGDYRIVNEIETDKLVVFVIKIAHRSQIYK